MVSKFLALSSLLNEDVWVNESRSQVVHIAATYCHPAILGELLKYGGDLNIRCPTCPFALMAAVKAQRLGTIKILVKGNAKVSEPDAFGRTPLSRAKDGHLELATKKLSELCAEENITLENVCSSPESTVKTQTPATSRSSMEGI